MRNGDADYLYRHDSYFYYMSGFPEPEAVIRILVAAAPQATARTILFCREKDVEREIWDGFRFGPEGACAEFGFDAAYPDCRAGRAKCRKLLADALALYAGLGGSDSRTGRAGASLASHCGARQARAGVQRAEQWCMNCMHC